MSIDLLGLTWQDLYDFVDLARSSGTPGDRNVDVIDDPDIEDCPHHLEVEVHGPFVVHSAGQRLYEELQPNRYANHDAGSD